VPPGTYEVTIRFKGHEAKGTVRVVADPATHSTDADWQAREAALRRAGELQGSLVEAIDRLGAARADVDVVIAKLRRIDAREAERKKAAGIVEPDAVTTPAPPKPLMRAAQQLRRKLGAAERRLFVPPGTKGIVDDRTPISRVRGALFSIDSSWDPPNATQRTELEQAETVTAAALQEVNRVLSEDVAAFHKQVSEARIDLLPAEPPIELPKSP
jgi:hypothetical protein